VHEATKRLAVDSLFEDQNVVKSSAMVVALLSPP